MVAQSSFGGHKMKINEKEFNALTGEETIIERELTPQEKKEREEPWYGGYT
jgi:hypothetical protein